MPISNTLFLRSTLTLLLIGLATLLVIVGLTGWLSLKTEDYSAQVFRGRQIRGSLVEVRSLLQDTETGQRGYLLARRDSYLQPYEEARARIEAALSRLEARAAGGPERDEVATLRPIVAAKLTELARTVDLVKSGRPDEALALLLTDEGKRLMDEARAIFERMLDATDARIGLRMNSQNTTLTALQWTTLVGALLVLIVVAASAVIAARYTRELIATRGELASLNAGLEKRVEERTAALARANEEIQRFAYVVSHDLRSPLVNIMGFASELEDMRPTIFAAPEAADAARQRLAREFDEALAFIRTSIGKMDGLISAILKLAREGGRTLASEPVELSRLVSEAADGVRHRVSEQGGRIDLDSTLPRIVSDRLALEQIFGNLLDNAVKYADPSRPIAIAISGRATPARVEIDIADNGRGIAEADRDRVFDLFRRAGRQDAPGEGIGLAHVRTLTRRLGGEITLRSELGAGSVFTVSLPSRLNLDI